MPRDPHRRKTIINGATRLFLERGYDGVAVDDICRATGSAKGSFYHFFRSKEDLAVQLVNEVWRQTEQELNDIFAESRAPLTCIRDELRKAARREQQGEDTESVLTGSPIGALAAALPADNDRIRKRLNFAFNHTRQYYEDCFKRAITDGSLPAETNAAAMADVVLAAVEGISVLARSAKNSARARRLIKHTLEVLKID